MLDGLSRAAEALFSVLVVASVGWLVVLAGAYALCDHSRAARRTFLWMMPPPEEGP